MWSREGNSKVQKKQMKEGVWNTITNLAADGKQRYTRSRMGTMRSSSVQGTLTTLVAMSVRRRRTALITF